MVDYKINFIKTDLTEVSEEVAYNGAYQVFYKKAYWDIWEVEEDYYHLLEVNPKEKGGFIKLEKSLFTEIYKPVIELLDETLNQLLISKELIISKQEYPKFEDIED